MFGAWTGRQWPAIVLTTAVLVLTYHLSDHPVVIAEAVIVGIAMGRLTIRTGGLEAAIGLFAVHRLLSTLVDQSLGIPLFGPTPAFTLLELLPSTASHLVAVLAYTWWTARNAPAPRATSATGPERVPGW